MENKPFDFYQQENSVCAELQAKEKAAQAHNNLTGGSHDELGQWEDVEPLKADEGAESTQSPRVSPQVPPLAGEAAQGEKTPQEIYESCPYNMGHNERLKVVADAATAELREEVRNLKADVKVRDVAINHHRRTENNLHGEAMSKTLGEIAYEEFTRPQSNWTSWNEKTPFIKDRWQSSAEAVAKEARRTDPVKAKLVQALKEAKCGSQLLTDTEVAKRFNAEVDKRLALENEYSESGQKLKMRTLEAELARAEEDAERLALAGKELLGMLTPGGFASPKMAAMDSALNKHKERAT